MKKVFVASTNPIKIASARAGFQKMFPTEEFEVLPVKNEVVITPQPFSDQETYEGARARALNIRDLEPIGDYWVGIEGGCQDGSLGMGTFAWVVVLSNDQEGCGRSGEFFLPEKVAELVRQGVELGEADDRVFSRNNSKQANGAVGILTEDVIDRESLYIPAVIFSLIPFKNPALYPKSEK
jgi:inosine/xanthosine triphosphatase